MPLLVEDLGRMDYASAHALQLERLDARVRGEIADTLLLLEHDPVITLGRGTNAANIKDSTLYPIVECERGGDVTLHAPGQIVGYLIRYLDESQRDLHAHLRLLEEILIESLGELGIRAERMSGKTGVWTQGRKIASLGVACRNWCTWHGFALNVDNNLDAFAAINPCGFDAKIMTSVARELGKKTQDLSSIKVVVTRVAQNLIR